MSSSGVSPSALAASPRGADNLLPPPPKDVPPNLTRPTSKYKRHAWIAGIGLLGFVSLYLFLTGWFCFTAYRLLAIAFGPGRTGLWPIVGGILSALLGAFLLSALFFIKTRSDATAHEIKAEEEPELFAFLYALADRVGAPRPHRVFLSPGVNAGVFYDLSLLNLLVPTKKNLDIGLGLVNHLTLSEFAAVLAHEFGHFAQRSMAVGRWVYTAQQVAGQIVIARGWLDKLLAGISAIDLRIAWVGWLMRIVVWSIRSLLDTAFRLVILAERALGREMELQADLVSVSVTGSDALIHALHRIGPADEAFGLALNVLAREAARGRAVPDVFAMQSRVLEHTARILNEPDRGASPKVPADHPEAHRIFEEELAQPPRMWSTHPPNLDRENNAKRTYVPAMLDSRSAFCLFRDAAALRRRVTAGILEKVETKPTPISEEEALLAVDERFGSTLLDERYRGAYLGRVVGLAAKSPARLVGNEVPATEIRERLAELYPEALAADIRDVRGRSDELAALEALRDGILDAPGGIIRHRGRIVPRRELAGLIHEVSTEVESIRNRVEAHDRACRAAHLAAARELGQGWENYLRKLLQLHHYAAHAEANLEDARGYLINVLAIVTADGRVSSGERKRLILASSDLHSALVEVYAHRDKVHLPGSMLQRLLKKIDADDEKDPPTTFGKLYGDQFILPHANEENLPSWLQAIDSWVDGPVRILGALERLSMEMLVEAEDHVRRAFEEGTDPGEAGACPVVPDHYQTLTRDQKRERQKQLGLWDRFQIADGFFPALARLVVAGGIMAVVIGATQTAAKPRETATAPEPKARAKANVLLVNGLDMPVSVELDGQTIALEAKRQRDVQVDPQLKLRLVARTAAGEEIEHLVRHVESWQSYVYNVAAATVLIQGVNSSQPSPPNAQRSLGALKWYSPGSDAGFKSWYAQQKAASQGYVQVYTTGALSADPSWLLQKAGTEFGREELIATHLEWDLPESRFLRQWLRIANTRSHLDALLTKRAQHYPLDISVMLLLQSRSPDEERKALCERIHTRAQTNPANLDWHFLALRCDHDEGKEGKVFLEAFQKYPAHPYLAASAGRELYRQKKYEEALAALEVASTALPLREEYNLLIARLLRVTGHKDAEAKILRLAEESNELADLMQIEMESDGEGPQRAYRRIEQGKLAEALKAAQGSPLVYRKVLVLAAASEGAPKEIVNEFLQSHASDSASEMSLVELALFDRLGMPHADFDAFLARRSLHTLEAVLPFGTLGFLEKGKGPVQAAWAALPIDQQADACLMALVRAPERAPTGCRPLVKAYFFTSERPYFK